MAIVLIEINGKRERANQDDLAKWGLKLGKDFKVLGTCVQGEKPTLTEKPSENSKAGSNSKKASDNGKAG